MILVIESPILVPFGNLPLCPFTEYNDFLEVCSILAKNLNNHNQPKYKLDNQVDTGRVRLGHSIS